MPQAQLAVDDYLQFQFATLDDFGGGITDNYVNAPVNTYERADNFYITDEPKPKLKTRQGSRIYDASAYRVVASRVSTLFNYDQDDELLAQGSQKVYYNNSGTWAEIQGPSSGSAFTAGDAGSVVSHSQWRGHLYLVNDDFSSAMKIYKDGSGDLQVRNAGLPALASDPTVTTILTDFIDLCIDIGAQLKDHGADADIHNISADIPMSTIGEEAANRAAEDWTYEDVRNFAARNAAGDAVTEYLEHNQDAAVTATLFHDATAAGHGFIPVATNLGTIKTAVNDFRTGYNGHDNESVPHDGVSGQYQVTEGAVSLASDFNTFTEADFASYIYGFAYVYSYTVGSVTYEDVGPITLIQREGPINIGSVSGTTLITTSISGIPTLSGENYDQANIDVRIYRTVANGSTLYKIEDIDNGTATYTDSKRDSELIYGAVAYTTGGVLDNDPPPLAKRVHVDNNTAIYGNLKDGSVLYPNRVVQSHSDDPDSVPESNFDDMQSEVVSVSSTNDKHIILCERHIYRRDGYYDAKGQGLVDHDVISDTAGCVAASSPVQIPGGLVWWGRRGVYFTDGYRVMLINKGWRTTYLTLVDTATKKEHVRGRFWEQQNVVVWSCQTSDSSSDNDALLVLHLNQGVKPYSAFTFYKSSTSFSPTALEVFSDQLIRAGGMTDGNMPGYLFKHDPTYTNDVRITNGESDPANWYTRTIIWDYKGPASAFGDSARTKRAARIWVTARNSGDVSLQINSINDDDSANKQASLKSIRFRGNAIHHKWRRFPANHLRFDYKQIQLTNAYTFAQTSDDVGDATVNDVAKTVTLNGGYTEVWDADAVEYFISFSDDDYVTQYEVTARTDETLTFTDSGGTAPSGVQDWQLKGYLRDEILYLQKYSIKFAYTGGSTAAYDSAQSGGNA